MNNNQNLHYTILSIGLCAAWADGKIHASEQKMLMGLANNFKLELPSIKSAADLPDLVELCNKLKSDMSKFEALEFTCRLLTADGSIHDDEKKFIDKLYSYLGFPRENYSTLLSFLDKSAESEANWFEFLQKFSTPVN